MEPAPDIDRELPEWPEYDENLEPYHRVNNRQWIVLGQGARQKKKLPNMD